MMKIPFWLVLTASFFLVCAGILIRVGYEIVTVGNTEHKPATLAQELKNNPQCAAIFDRHSAELRGER